MSQFCGVLKNLNKAWDAVVMASLKNTLFSMMEILVWAHTYVGSLWLTIGLAFGIFHRPAYTLKTGRFSDFCVSNQ